MNQILKVRNGYQHYFVENGLNEDINEMDKVIIQTPKGKELCVVERQIVVQTEVVGEELVTLVRQASDKDLEQAQKNEEQKQMFAKVFKETARTMNLEMNLVDIYILHNRERVMFFYMSDGRIDFREFVKKLATVVKTRVELRQVSDRERAKLIGGIGPCGYELCCSNFLQEFATVNVRMAKMQQLSFNLQRVTGLCDRLLCCLKYENDQYVEMKKDVPDLNRRIILNDGRSAKVQALQLIAQTITLRYEDYSVEKFDFTDFFNIYTKPEKQEE